MASYTIAAVYLQLQIPLTGILEPLLSPTPVVPKLFWKIMQSFL